MLRPCDAIVLDITPLGLNGLELCQKLRSDLRNATPVLMLTACDSLPDKVAGFESGADDYLVKPFSLVELDMRLMASATFYDATLQRTAGRVNEGNYANGVPKRTFNVGADWDLPWVAGLSVNARGIYTAETPFDVANRLQLPSWSRYDIGARYRTEVMGKPVGLRASVENVFNKAYWLSSSTLLMVGTVAAPRTVLMSAQFDF